MEGGLISLQTLWDTIQNIKTEMLTHFDSKMDPIYISLCNIQTSLNTLGEQVSELEQCVSSNEDNVQDHQTQLQHLEKENAYLVDKVEDLENRSRSSNLRFVKVLELAEGCDIYSFMSKLIPDLLGHENFPVLPVIERAHRSPTTQRDVQIHPQPILIKLHNFQDKVKILRLVLSSLFVIHAHLV